MKLRIRSVNGGETFRIDISADSNLQSLKNAVAQSRNFLNSEIYLSLNKKVELQIPPQEQLQSFGIRGGDLVFYTLDPNYFKTNVSENPDRQYPISNSSNPTPIENSCNSSRTESLSANESHQNQRINPTDRSPCQNPTHVTPSQNPDHQTLRELCASAAMKRARNGSSSNPSQSAEVGVEKPEEGKGGDEPGAMDVDGEFVEISRSVPYFFKRVLAEELENVKGAHGLLILAVHAVMLESGFLGFDVKNSKGLLGFRLPQNWNAKLVVSISYTLSELFIDTRDGKDVENVELKFNDTGNHLVVYGRVVSSKGSQNYRLCLESGKFSPSLEHVTRESYANKESQNVGKTLNGEIVPLADKPQDSSTHESVRFELWRVVKDRLCMPVLTTLCENAGLPLPPSLIMLPTELKMKILEALPAEDIIKVGCVSTEFRYMSANDELWKQKYVNEIGPLPPDGSKPPGALRWKDAFVKIWLERKTMNQSRRRRFMEGFRLPHYRPWRRCRFPFATPGFGISGGDFDRFPAIGDGNLWVGRGGGNRCLLGAVNGGRRPGYPFVRTSIILDCDLNEHRLAARTDLDLEDTLFPDM